MSGARKGRSALAWLLAGAAGLGLGIAAMGSASAPAPRTANEQAFLKENEVAMKRMMAGMSIEPSGDIDRDFVSLMAAHHQGAIDMAVDVLRYGRNERIRRIAQEIIVEQQQQIAAMRLAVADPPTLPAGGSATQSMGAGR